MSKAPVRGLKEFPHTGGLSMRERNELPSWLPGQSIIPVAQTRKEKRKWGNFLQYAGDFFFFFPHIPFGKETTEHATSGSLIQKKNKQTKLNQLDELSACPDTSRSDSSLQVVKSAGSKADTGGVLLTLVFDMTIFKARLEGGGGGQKTFASR